MKSTIFPLKNKNITVMGLGLYGGGVGITKWLARQGNKIVITDLQEEEVLQPSIDQLKEFDIEYVLGEHRDKDFSDTDLIIKNPGVPRDSKYLEIARANSIPIETDMSIFFQLCQAPIIGITGTKGKSTTTSLIYEMSTAAKLNPVMAGNIRISPLEQLNKITEDTPVILELSSWQLEDMDHIKKSPQIAVMTNILPDHLNRYDSMEDYFSAKKVIFKYQNKNDYIVLNDQVSEFKSLEKQIVANKFWFSISEKLEKNGCYLEKGWIKFKNNDDSEIVCHMKDLEIPGDHNLANTLAAIAVAKIWKIDNKTIKGVLQKFKGISGRLELVVRWKGVEFYNDTTATSPVATIAALDSFDKQVILIAGGTDKNLDYSELAKQLSDKVKYLFLLEGTATDKIVKCIPIKSELKYEVHNDMQTAVNKANRISQKGDVVLLSPGAASFGLFQNEFDRGDEFIKAVSNLK